LRAIADTAGPVVLFFAMSDETLAFVMVPGKPLAVVLLPVRWEPVSQRIAAFLDDLANVNYATRARDEAHALWRDLFAPFADRLPESGPLVLIPSGMLYFLPFEALLDDHDRRFFERYDFTVVPSLAILGELQKRHRTPSPGDTMLTLAAGQALQSVTNEAHRLGALVGTAHWVGVEREAATAAAYRALAPAARQLLIASHAVYDTSMERRTFIEVSPTADHDDRLSAIEIASIFLAAELVTLAACDTGNANVYFSDERLDLARGFLVAGAATVLATRWRLPDDDSVSRFLVDFYTSYLGGQRKDHALAEARRRAVGRGDPAEVWAAWVLTGDPQ